MVDCRLCKHAYRIWNDGSEPEEDTYKLVCMQTEMFVGKEYLTTGDCEYYVDVDGYNTEN